MKATRPLNFGVLVVPHCCDDADSWDLLIEKSKKFRLDALRESPEAFSSTYEREVSFEKDVWAGRLANVQVTMLVFVKDLDRHNISNDTGKVQTLLENEWLAMTVLHEVEELVFANVPASNSLWHKTNGDQQSLSRGNMTFVLNGVYVAPDYRGRCAGSAALEHVFEVGQVMTAERGLPEVQFKVLVDAANDAASKLYKKVGFQEVRREQLHMGEKVKNGRVIPAHEATILVLERVISIPVSYEYNV
ncbi:hypothetical protein ACMFMG_009175 [Clarireedia jacksonii]